MQLTDFHFDLPNELIARYPLEKRSDSRLLQVGPAEEPQHGQFSNLLSQLTDKDLIVFNQSKVIPARLYGQKESGGRVEILVERVVDAKQLLVHLRASKSPKPGSTLIFSDYRFKMLGRADSLFILEADFPEHVLEVIEKIGEIPLPPYMNREAEASDLERYQTVYAKDKGSVAAPTAGLHFDQETMDALKAKGVETAFLTLHVGAGTFLPVRTDNILEHHMHPEYLQVSEELCQKVKATKARGGRVLAVGTTSARALESASREGELKPFQGDTSLFIYPGFQWHTVDLLLTNFHLPESTLMMLVCAFGGYEKVMRAYREAVDKLYRFYSYGDAMLVTKSYP